MVFLNYTFFKFIILFNKFYQKQNACQNFNPISRYMINPKESIIIPIYNSEKYLKKCINSLIKQTFLI